MSAPVTIVVIAADDPPALERTLAALPQSAAGAAFEVAVVVETAPDEAVFANVPYAFGVYGYPPEIAPGDRLNDAIGKAGGDTVVFLPAGAVPERHWLRAIDAALSRPEVAGVIPRIVDATGAHVRACGTGIMSGRFAHAHAGFARDAKYVLRPTGLDLAPLCGMALRKAHFARVHGFDAAFDRSMFDFDWTLRARIEGLVIAYRPDYTLRYDGSLPLGQTPAERASAEYFLGRWQTVFRPNLRAEVFLP